MRTKWKNYEKSFCWLCWKLRVFYIPINQSPKDGIIIYLNLHQKFINILLLLAQLSAIRFNLFNQKVASFSWCIFKLSPQKLIGSDELVLNFKSIHVTRNCSIWRQGLLNCKWIPFRVNYGINLIHFGAPGTSWIETWIEALQTESTFQSDNTCELRIESCTSRNDTCQWLLNIKLNFCIGTRIRIAFVSVYRVKINKRLTVHFTMHMALVFCWFQALFAIEVNGIDILKCLKCPCLEYDAVGMNFEKKLRLWGCRCALVVYVSFWNQFMIHFRFN